MRVSTVNQQHGIFTIFFIWLGIFVYVNVYFKDCTYDSVSLDVVESSVINFDQVTVGMNSSGVITGEIVAFYPLPVIPSKLQHSKLFFHSLAF